MRRRVVGWLAGGAAGLAVALPAALIPGHGEQTSTASEPAEQRFGPGGNGPGDFMQEVIAAVRADHVYIAPETGVALGDTELAAVRAAATAGEVPVYLAFLPDRDRAGAPGYANRYDALDQLMAGVGEPGYYAVLDSLTLAVTDAVGYRWPYADSDLLQGRPGPALTRYVTALAAEPPEPPYDDTAASDDDGYWGGPVSATAAGLLMGVGGFLGLLALVSIAGAIRRAWR